MENTINKALLTAGFAVCLGSAALGTHRGSPTIQKGAMADAINGFTFRLIQHTGTPTGKNILISPFSVSTALGMLVPGAVGGDQKLLINTLAPKMTPREIGQGSHDLFQSILSAPGAPLSIANSVWVDSKMPIKPAYIAGLKKDYSAQAFLFNHDNASVQKVNTWVSAKTKERIPHILDQIKPADRIFLVNAIAFDGVWEQEFLKSRTFEQPFHRVANDDENVPMMHMKATVPYFKNEILRAIRLDYKGKDFSMLLMLPERGKDAGALLRSLTAATISSISSHLESSDDLQVTLPKFNLTDSYQLAAPLAAMGLSSLFHGADLSGISERLRTGKIDRIIHKTFIEVDEKGTKAAAATVVAVHATAMRMNAPEFIADRPFAFLIMHNPTHTILFAGVVNDPKTHG